MVLIPGPGLNPKHLKYGEENLILEGSIDHRGKEVKSVSAQKIKDGLARFKEEKITLGHQISGNLNYHRRILTAYYNTAVSSVHQNFINSIETSLKERDIEAELYLLKSDGGTAALENSRKIPIETVNSGPAASIMGSLLLNQSSETGIALDIEGIVEYNPEIVTDREIKRAHICVPDVDSVASEPHKISAGGAVKAADLVLEGIVDKGFALVRPPGHHAHRVVHDPNVLHISLHQDGGTLFPGSGFVNEFGGPTAYARTLNIPLPPGTFDQGLLYVINDFVLPVLNDFQPDLVINAAGQDNHYFDPLTNMNISARGYAEMNELLDPDLSILQGGYSIESALPYINVGLILAVAGLDYSFVEEPDYDPDLLKEDPSLTSEIKETVAQLKKIWESRESRDLKEVYGDFSKFYSREKNIFYDTAGINESQTEKVRVCPDCQGYPIIESKAAKSRFSSSQVMAVSIPKLVCDHCHQEAREKYEGLKKEHDHVYLQDLKEDEYLSS
ncbi:acetoin utilization deacetylase AcuC-like enzyme [Halanaerobium saccharolyticum]|uniref:Acetoin utilization deacetylase AcuC-like enzyme n=1 Tax=Halanaerobium saccharolyticum TaxID=43595 RepID=A0A4R6LVC7_9FIRM|nr:hydantoinase/oxoprolinase family protein [Halanaerobium saccharolyticum]TDO92006.1 acetoin utilization deacetylase AcuC-like enzyme [Halanaerobium saccharolyticum]